MISKEQAEAMYFSQTKRRGKGQAYFNMNRYDTTTLNGSQLFSGNSVFLGTISLSSPGDETKDVLITFNCSLGDQFIEAPIGLTTSWNVGTVNLNEVTTPILIADTIIIRYGTISPTEFCTIIFNGWIFPKL